MNWLKNFGATATNSVLRFLLFFGVTLACLAYLITDPNTIKNDIKEVNGYEKFTSAVIVEAEKAYQGSNSLPFNDPQIKKIITEAFSEDALRPATEKAINGIYAWLEGKQDTPKFQADFTFAKIELADKLSAYAFERLSKQPVCFAVPENIDPFTSGCRPPYTDLSVEQLKFREQLLGNQGFLPNSVLTEANLPKNSEGEYIYEQYSYAPTVFKWLKLSPWLVLAIAVTMSIFLIAFSKSFRGGMRQVGFAFLSTGAALLFTPLLFGYILPRFSDSLAFKVSGGGNAVQEVFGEVTNSITNDFYSLLINVSIQIMLLGAIIILIEKFTRSVSPYQGVARKSGVVSSNTRKPRANTKRKYQPDTIPLQSSEESSRRQAKKTKNKKYRKIPRKEI